jgi:phosphoribosyl-ATP pyrophosphohydrolase
VLPERGQADGGWSSRKATSRKGSLIVGSDVVGDRKSSVRRRKVREDAAVLDDLEAVLRTRRDDPPDGGSYSADLLRDPERTQRKIMEEAFEVCLELGRATEDRRPDRIASEAADLVFHLLVGLVGADVPFSAVLDELAARRR